MPNLKASLALRLLAGLFTLLGVTLAGFGFARFGGVVPTEVEFDPILAATGASVFALGTLGPLRIGLFGGLLPAEIRRTILIMGSCLSVSGLALAASGAFGAGGSLTLALLVCGICAITAASVGFYGLSTKMPDNFYLHEMLAIVKTVNLGGKKEDSVSNREFMRWTGGVRKGAAVGAAAPDGKVISLQGETFSLSRYFHGDGIFSPLVLNLGSYTCPHHRKRIPELHRLMDQWEPRGARFLTVYTAEAHPSDGWELPGQYSEDEEYKGNDADFCFFYAKTLDERKHMAQWLLEKKRFRLPLVLDSMEDAIMRAYNSWPIRLYIIDAGQVVFTGKQGPFGYGVDEAEAALARLASTHGQ